jgi:hypothetical protein
MLPADTDQVCMTQHAGRASAHSFWVHVWLHVGVLALCGLAQVWEVKREKPFKPTHEAGSALPFEGASLYRQDFGPKEAPYERVRPKHAFQPNNAPFDGGCAHQGGSLQHWQGQRCCKTGITHQGVGCVGYAGCCTGTTTNRTDFMPREVVPTARVQARGANIPTSAGPFDGSSLYKDTFQWVAAA